MCLITSNMCIYQSSWEKWYLEQSGGLLGGNFKNIFRKIKTLKQTKQKQLKPINYLTTSSQTKQTQLKTIDYLTTSS